MEGTVPAGDEVVVIDPEAPPANPEVPAVLWVAPGSVGDPGAVWQRHGRLEDLASVSGPWAMALWDPHGRRHLLVTDPVGLQPLFWARTTEGRIAAASWMAQLVDRPDVDDAVDCEGVLLDLVGAPTPLALERTRFKDVRRVFWGRALCIEGHRTPRLEQYWHPERLATPDWSLSLGDCAALLRERIDAALVRLAPLDVPVASHVSGGIDCSTMACRANQLLRDHGSELAVGYSWAPDESIVPRVRGDERELLDLVTEQEGFEIRRPRWDASGDWFLDVEEHRYPPTTLSAERFSLPHARDHGIRVILSGWGGDELASFNGSEVAMMALVRRGRLGTVLRHAARRFDVLQGRPAARARVLRSAAVLTARGLPGVDRLVGYRDRREELARAEGGAAILAEHSELAADSHRRWIASLVNARTPQDYMLARLGGGHLQLRSAAWYQSARRFDVWYRYPLLDLGVVEAALALPPHAFRSEGWGRIAYREAVRDWVPAPLLWQTVKNEPARNSAMNRVTVPRRADGSTRTSVSSRDSCSDSVRTHAEFLRARLGTGPADLAPTHTNPGASPSATG